MDLAGTEWDTGHYEKQRRMEAAEINKSLMALKECIRALDSKKHVPFRTNKMTLMLKDSFVSDNAKVIMIVCVAPAISFTDHTLITLKYATSFRENQSRLSQIVPAKNFGGKDDFEIRPPRKTQGIDEEGQQNKMCLYRNSSQKYIKYASGKKLSVNESIDYLSKQPLQLINENDEKPQPKNFR